MGCNVVIVHALTQTFSKYETVGFLSNKAWKETQMAKTVKFLDTVSLNYVFNLNFW